MMYLLNVLLAAVAVTVITAELSPVLLWSPERSMVDLPDVSNADSFSSSDFYNQYLGPVMQDGKQNSVVFLQDKLSVDDFTKHADVFSVDSDGGAFKNIKRLVDDHFSLEIPQVDSPHTAIDQLKEKFEGLVHVVNDPAQLHSIRLGNNKRFLLIVNLHPIIGADNIEKTISQNDAMVGVVTKHLHDKGIAYAALFTGQSAGVPEEEPVGDESVHSGRHLLATAAAATEPCMYQNVSTTGGNILVYLCSFKVCIKTKCVAQWNTTLTNTSAIASASTKTNNTATVNLVLNGVDFNSGNAYTADLSIAVVLQQDRWIMSRFSANLAPTTVGKGNYTFKNATLMEYGLETTIPRLYSFHCTQLTLSLDTLSNATNKDLAGSYIQLNKFQFQVFDLRNKGFFYAQDCVGFFTAGIWMGIVPGLLMVVILVWGTLMVLNLSVMDKFDNPKGKTITINTGE